MKVEKKTVKEIHMIGFSGKIGSGKTTTAKALVSLFENKGVSDAEKVNFAEGVSDAERVNFAEGVRDIYELLTGDSKENTRTAEQKKALVPGFDVTRRHALQKIGNMARSAIGPDVWLKYLFRATVNKVVANSTKDCVYIIVDDVRYPNEKKMIEAFSAKSFVVRMETKDTLILAKTPAEKRSERDNAPSEIALDDFPWEDEDVFKRSDYASAKEIAEAIWKKKIK